MKKPVFFLNGDDIEHRKSVIRYIYKYLTNDKCNLFEWSLLHEPDKYFTIVIITKEVPTGIIAFDVDCFAQFRSIYKDFFKDGLFD